MKGDRNVKYVGRHMLGVRLARSEDQKYSLVSPAHEAKALGLIEKESVESKHRRY
jgi:hypothetical protein